jgi:thiol-disulfide isomerase/thioredoxin
MQSSFGPGITLIDFTAKWCGPCKVMEPVMATLANEYAGRVKVVAIDVDDEQLLAQQFNVRSMPTFVSGTRWQRGRPGRRQSAARVHRRHDRSSARRRPRDREPLASTYRLRAACGARCSSTATWPGADAECLRGFLTG